MGRPRHPLSPWILLVAILTLLVKPTEAGVKVRLADGFDYPVGKPNAEGYYKARGLRLRSPVHFGEDWNGRGGGDTDLHDPLYAIADGVVAFAYDIRAGWGRVVIVRHAYRDPETKQIRYIDALYGHCRKMLVKVGDKVKRGQQIATMGNNRGMYRAHLHFEIRHNLKVGMHRSSVGRTYANWANPSKFIEKYRRLKKESKKVAVPTGTYKPYRNFKGL
ncbi:murein hydrolase activator EnvC family protein [Rubritalea marina]|uniref:murein hydrolase activator EnvC family protein n=1 Tax=Rubritalea marina TaxID=361055 RepID=UPI0003652ED9|nr:M23 family metallopeptidase [Rubritalea marina]